MHYEPITEDDLDDLQETIGQGGASRELAQRLMRELRRAEAERARLQRELESASESRNALRASLLEELMRERQLREDAERKLVDAASQPVS